MNRLKKAMSIVLSTVMILGTCLCTVSAEELISVTYWNADSTKIMIDLSEEVAEADLKDAITLTADGTAVTDFDVVKKPASKETTHGMTANTDYSYVIKPEGGVEFDDVYNLNIAGTDCNKFFSVEELWKDDFQTYEGDTGATTSWRNGTLYVDGTEKYLKITGMAGKGVYPYYDAYNFSTYGMTATKFFDATRLATADYSVEVKVKADESNAANINRTLQISMQTDRTERVGKWGKPGFCGGAQNYKSADGTNEYNRMYLNAYQKYASNDGRQGIGTMQDNMKDCGGMTVDEQTLDADWTALSMSVKGNNAKVFAGEDAFANYNHTIDLSTGYGAVVFVSRSSGTYYIDDVIVSKAKEVVTPDFGTSLNVVDAEEGKVNVSWEYDGKGNNLPCKVILACYGENNSLKNVIPWDGTNLSGNGTITFENFELKGGTELKLFVWKDLTTLYPYCATVQWPQAD